MIPKTRGECVLGPRPCPHVTCRHHLGADARETCSLDVADRGGATDREIGQLLGGISKQAVQKIAKRALTKFPAHLRVIFE